MKYLKKLVCPALVMLFVMLTACSTGKVEQPEPERSVVSGKIQGDTITIGNQSFSRDEEKVTLNLQIRSNEILDLSVLSQCTQLQRLSINLTVISHIGYDKFNKPYIVEQTPVDLKFISALSSLARLELNIGSGVDLSPLAGLPNLSALVLWVDGEIDLSPLADCPALIDLSLGGRGTVDLSPIKNFPELKRLRVDVYDADWNTPDLSVLSGARCLETLSIGASRGLKQLTDVPLKKLVDVNDSGDILENLPAIPTLEYLEFSDENIHDISPLLQHSPYIPEIVLEVGIQEMDNFTVIASADDPLLEHLITSIPAEQLKTLLSREGVTITLRMDQNRSAVGNHS